MPRLVAVFSVSLERFRPPPPPPSHWWLFREREPRCPGTAFSLLFLTFTPGVSFILSFSGVLGFRVVLHAPLMFFSLPRCGCSGRAHLLCCLLFCQPAAVYPSLCCTCLLSTFSPTPFFPGARSLLRTVASLTFLFFQIPHHSFLFLHCPLEKARPLPKSAVGLLRSFTSDPSTGEGIPFPLPLSRLAPPSSENAMASQKDSPDLHVFN